MKKTITRIVSLTMALALLFTMTACSPSAKEPEHVEGSANLTYELSEDGTYYIMTDASTCGEADIVVGNWHDGKPVKAIGDMAFKFAEGLHSIKVAEGVVTYGECWVDNGTVKRVECPDGVESLGVAAFLICFELDEIVIGKGLKRIEVDTFEKVNENLTIYFRGTEEEWNAVEVPEQGNALLNSCKMVFNYKD